MECRELASQSLDRMRSAPPSEADPLHDMSPDVALVQQLVSVPILLETLCELTGMRVAAVVRISQGEAVVCAIQDGMDLHLKPGEPFGFEMPPRRGADENRPMVVEHASSDPRFRTMSGERSDFESYAAAPIMTRSGQHFGNLCVLDRSPAHIGAVILSTLKRFAALIGAELEDERRHTAVRAALREEHTSSELREQFIAILGHDLRNPLQAIVATSEILGRHLQAVPALAAMAGRIKVNSKRMSSLIDDVLDFARGRLGGGIGLQVEGTNNLDTSLTSVVKELQEGQPTRSILANISVTRTVHCDVGRIQQVASNLIGNALTHGNAQTPVKVTAHTDEQDLIFEVWNQGEPIPPESIDKVFEPFWRHSTSPTRGLGLGLHICSQIVRAHGGKLSVNSTKEAGTRFTMRLPLHLLF